MIGNTLYEQLFTYEDEYNGKIKHYTVGKAQNNKDYMMFIVHCKCLQTNYNYENEKFVRVFRSKWGIVQLTIKNT